MRRAILVSLVLFAACRAGDVSNTDPSGAAKPVEPAGGVPMVGEGAASPTTAPDPADTPAPANTAPASDPWAAPTAGPDQPLDEAPATATPAQPAPSAEPTDSTDPWATTSKDPWAPTATKPDVTATPALPDSSSTDPATPPTHDSSATDPATPPTPDPKPEPTKPAKPTPIR